ncbi:MAG: discoidin domain-containing protein [Geobacter sp.]|nr:discoidin domain-containing protein [Geobacter sp.]
MRRQIRTIVYLALASVLLTTQLWAEQWKISFNGYPGTMELSGSHSNYSGRFNLHGNWEQMLDLQVYRNTICFRRAAADQKYLGVMEEGRMQGVFTQHGSGHYPWTAERADTTIIDPISGGGTGPTKNLALKKQVRQSTTGYGGNPECAVDGNREGNYSSNSVTHTDNAPNDWWEVDLGSQKQIQEIKLWNRTDCCSERLSNFYVMVSQKPFSDSNLQSSLNDPSIWHFHHPGAAARETTVAVAGVGRYVRIQLAGQNWLSLAEVEVIGTEP